MLMYIYNKFIEIAIVHIEIALAVYKTQNGWLIVTFDIFFVNSEWMAHWHIWFFFFVAAFLTQTVCLDDTTVKFEIWDTAGQERYHSLAPMYYRGAQAAIVVYDITNQVSNKGVILLRNVGCFDSQPIIWVSYCHSGTGVLVESSKYNHLVLKQFFF